MWINNEMKTLIEYRNFYTYLIPKLNITLAVTFSAFHFWYIK